MIDINLANQILSEEIVNTEKKSDIIKLALSILENKFQADFTVRDEAVKSASDAQQLVNKKDGEINQLLSDLQEHKNVIKERDVEISSYRQQIAEITTEKYQLVAEKEAVESELATVTTAKEAVETELSTVKTELDTLKVKSVDVVSEVVETVA